MCGCLFNVPNGVLHWFGSVILLPTSSSSVFFSLLLLFTSNSFFNHKLGVGPHHMSYPSSAIICRQISFGGQREEIGGRERKKPMQCQSVETRLWSLPHSSLARESAAFLCVVGRYKFRTFFEFRDSPPDSQRRLICSVFMCLVYYL